MTESEVGLESSLAANSATRDLGMGLTSRMSSCKFKRTKKDQRLNSEGRDSNHQEREASRTLPSGLSLTHLRCLSPPLMGREVMNRSYTDSIVEGS